MSSRFRGLAALVALLALTLFLAEGLWASMCSGGMEMGMAVATEVADAGAPEAGPAAAGQTGHSQDQDAESSQVPDCPLVPAGAASCTGGIALLSVSAAPETATVGDELAVSSYDHAQDLLLAVSLLRPPQA